MEINEILDIIYQLPAQSKSELIDCITEIKHNKGYILLRANKVEKNIYFIKKGIVRAYSNLGESQITFWFGQEGDTVISMKSYVANQKGYEDVELLENCELYKLEVKDLQNLFEKDLHIANWGRKFVELELVKTEERLISRQFRIAADRYKELVQDNADLIKRVQLGHIASYLGITQVSLSRIRAEMK